ncbi:MAG TPA: MFS transporter [Bryobacteraceae bacterium]|nr:MFS transporter [Bryobacteraceae bacterium]
MERVTGATVESQNQMRGQVVISILAVISFCHLLNDMVQSLLPAIYPILKSTFHLDFAQIGMITLTYQLTASLLQPLIGGFTDRRPLPYSLPWGMGFTMTGLVLLATASNFGMILIASSVTGIGSAIFHPESSRVARMASGGQHGMAQSVFQVGGNFGSSLGPLLAAFIVLPHGQISIAWFTLAALLAMLLLSKVGAWYKHHERTKPAAHTTSTYLPALSRARIAVSIGILLALIFSKYIYLASLTSYYQFYLISRFHVSVQNAQIHLFLFLGAVAAGTVIGGPIGDRFGRKYVIWCSILGVLPFTLMLPYANLLWTAVLSIVVGFILASAFSTIVVYGQELMPGKIGTVAGLFFGFAFGAAGVGAAFLGNLADRTSIDFVYRLCSFLPAIGLLTGFLPNLDRRKPVLVC